MPIGHELEEVSLFFNAPDILPIAQQVCEEYGFALVDKLSAIDEKKDSFLEMSEDGLALVANTKGKERVKVDFLAGRSGYRISTIANTAQPVLKAVGFNKDRVGLRVLDATAGLGVDGMIMAAAGCNVTLLERSSVMVALLEDGFRRLQLDHDATEMHDIVEGRVVLHRVDSVEFLNSVGQGQYDVIYLDPMFPERKKSSKVKKEMQLARVFTECEDNALELLEAALATSVRRVVIKRPLKAPIVKKGFSSQIKGKSIRFDVFVR